MPIHAIHSIALDESRSAFIRQIAAQERRPVSDVVREAIDALESLYNATNGGTGYTRVNTLRELLTILSAANAAKPAALTAGA